jgi:hypothetical protein
VIDALHQRALAGLRRLLAGASDELKRDSRIALSQVYPCDRIQCRFLSGTGRQQSEEFLLSLLIPLRLQKKAGHAHAPHLVCRLNLHSVAVMLQGFFLAASSFRQDAQIDVRIQVLGIERQGFPNFLEGRRVPVLGYE